MRAHARKIRLLLLDIDGVLTDGGVVMDDRGDEIKRFHVRDGQGIRLLMEAGIEVAFITGRSSRVVEHRAKDLGVRRVYQNVKNKLDVYHEIKTAMALKDNEIAYVGDDIADLPLMRRVGFPVTVQDGWKELRRESRYVTRRRGGEGAIRELAELLLKAQRKWKEVTQKYYQQ
ncbi:MAG: HAD-IIIA family hydrolase [Deltaproteobacteria bacterium]|nr:HAD-IIIA family hydrolase [Deltaproteobacteria bacterium]